MNRDEQSHRSWSVVMMLSWPEQTKIRAREGGVRMQERRRREARNSSLAAGLGEKGFLEQRVVESTFQYWRLRRAKE